MQRGSLGDLVALVAVGRERFTKAAAKLGDSLSSMDSDNEHRRAEQRLGSVDLRQAKGGSDEKIHGVVYGFWG
jgi:hypothetical protein